MSVISNSTLAGSSGQGGGAGYEIERSLRFNSGDSAYLSRTPSSAGNRRTYTWSGWVKRSALGSGTYYFLTAVDSSNADILGVEADSLYWTNAYSGAVTSTDKFRDPSAWYHIIFAVDSTQLTDSNRVKMYANGRQITSFSSTLWPSLNRDFAINAGVAHQMGRYFTTSGSNFYLADINFIDGQALTPSDFGEYDTNNVWQPKEFTGTYGTNGFHLDFSDTSSNAALGTDASGNGNTWTVNNLTANAIDYASNYSLTGSIYAASYSPDNLFDGSTISAVLLLNSSSTLTYTFDTPIAFSSTFEVYYTNGVSATTMDINGVSQTINNNYPTREWLSASGITSPVTSLSWSGTNGANGPYVYAVRVDGNILIGAPASETDALRDSPTNGDPTSDTGVGGEVVGNYATLNPLLMGISMVQMRVLRAQHFRLATLWALPWM